MVADEQVEHSVDHMLATWAAPPELSPLRVCGDCGSRIRGEGCVRCVWRVEVAMQMLLGPPGALPTCPWCMHAGSSFEVSRIGAGEAGRETRHVPWCHDGSCVRCRKSAYQWQRDELGRRLLQSDAKVTARVAGEFFELVRTCAEELESNGRDLLALETADGAPVFDNEARLRILAGGAVRDAIGIVMAGAHHEEYMERLDQLRRCIEDAITGSGPP